VGRSAPQSASPALRAPGPTTAQSDAPPWGEDDGWPALREPAAHDGIGERSRVFFLLHRHRFGRFVLATAGDEPPGEREATPAGAWDGGEGRRLYEDSGRVLVLNRMRTGAGSRSHGLEGLLWAIRAAGLPKGRRWPAHEVEPDQLTRRILGRRPCGETSLERAVFDRVAFRWPPDPRWRTW
jgi:hypothetical protein